MATTVNSAFTEFLRDTVNLDNSQTQIARKSRDNLLSNIRLFSGENDFFTINGDRSLFFGSFARHTKLRPLDDIDIMICISGSDDRQYLNAGNGTYYMGANQTDIASGLNIYGTNCLNSTRVINRFISKLSELNDYSKAEIHKNHEAATLKLKTYDWTFDIVPCFYCVGDFYLIPDGNGNWKKTDPRIDNDRTTSINQSQNGNLLSLIRLVKYWNKRNNTITISSYLLECMILNRYDNKVAPEKWWIDLQFKDTLLYLSAAIYNSVIDPKGIQGDLNSYCYGDRVKISEALKKAYYKAVEAFNLEINDSNQKAAIKKWQEVLGVRFPNYTGA